MGKLKLSEFLIACFVLFSFGCSPTLIKYVDPKMPIQLENDEKIVLGQIIFTMHSEKKEEMSFPPIGLGLYKIETEERAKPPRVASMSQPWFAKDGLFVWKMEKGSYQIDALTWGCDISLFSFSSEGNLIKPKQPPSYLLAANPQKPLECGFVVNPNVIFTVSGDSAALYLGTLRIDLDVETTRGIVVKKINSIDVIDSYDKIYELFKDRFPGESLTFEKSLMSCTHDRVISFTNGHCPAGMEKFVRLLLEIILTGISHMSPGPPSR